MRSFFRILTRYIIPLTLIDVVVMSAPSPSVRKWQVCLSHSVTQLTKFVSAGWRSRPMHNQPFGWTDSLEWSSFNRSTFSGHLCQLPTQLSPNSAFILDADVRYSDFLS